MKGDGGREHRALLEPARVALRPPPAPPAARRAQPGSAPPPPALQGKRSAGEREEVPPPPGAGGQRRGDTERAGPVPSGRLCAPTGPLSPYAASAVGRAPPPGSERPRGLRAAGKGSWPARGDLSGSTSATGARGGRELTSTSPARGRLTRAGSAPRPRASLAPRARETGSGRALPAVASDASLLPGRRGLAQDHAYSIREEDR